MKKLKLNIINPSDTSETILDKHINNEQKIDVIQSITFPNNELRSTRKHNNCNVVSNNTEQDVIEILKGFDCVKDVWKDRYNSKFDIYYVLNDENVIRGLQIKTITKLKSYDDLHTVNDLHKYFNGMLIVCLNKLTGIGFTYIDSDYYRTKAPTFSINNNPVNKFEKLILQWDQFILKLKEMVCYGVIITPELYKNSISTDHYTEYESIERFKYFCKKYNLNCVLNYDNSSPTDLFVNGFKIQMKYSGRIIGEKTSNYSYDIQLSRSADIKYKKGDNDFYVLEIGGYHGDFLWLPQNLLIAKGYISENISVDEPSKCHMSIFAHDYVEKKLLTTNDKDKHKVKGNWSCNKKYWFSTEKGCLKDSGIDIGVYIKNLFLENFVTSDKLQSINLDYQSSENINIIECSPEKKLSFKVKQYDLKGNYIKTFNDVGAAALEVKIANRSISSACESKSKISAGFKWEYDINQLSDNTKKPIGINKKVNQYNLDGSYVRTFDSISDAAFAHDLRISQISNVCNKKSDPVKFIWRFTDSCINLTDNLTIEEIKRPSHGCKQVDQFDLNGVFIRRFDSASQACKELATPKLYLTKSGISGACTGILKTYKKFIWKYVD